MSYLMSIDEDVQKFAEVIENVLDVDVTIVDNEYKRVAGTGTYKNMLGSSINMGTVYAKVFETGESYFIDNPRHSVLCNTCSNKNSCSECAEVCCPIILEDRIIGVIGLIAFEEKQKQELLINKESLREFLSKMADLISSKVKERDVLMRNKVLRKQLKTIIDTIDEGIIAVNQEGKITHCNYAAGKILKLKSEEILGKELKDRLPVLERQISISRGRDISNWEFGIKNGEYIRGLLSTREIVFNKSYIGTVLILRALSDIRKVINHLSGVNLNIYFDDIIGVSKAISDVKEKAMKASLGDSTIFIMGESGTGKEMFARAIHSYSPRRDKAFVAVNCAAIPETLLESELFGYEEGAFTGAKKGGKIGKFELANGGTIFLDEVGDMPLHLQTKLLRVLQDKYVERIGGRYGFPVDVRVIAATHKEIFKMLRDGEFRHDLFYRLNVIPLNIPPLKERREDIPLLMEYMLKKCNIKLSKSLRGFTEEVMDLFLMYGWNGNIRELENTIEYASNMETKDLITLNSLPPRFKGSNSLNGSECIRPVKELERDAIINALNVLGCGNKDRAAQALGMSRATFYRKIKEYNIVSK